MASSATMRRELRPRNVLIWRFHLSMIAAARLLKAQAHNPAQLQAIAASGTTITEADLKGCLAVLGESLSARVDATGDGPDKIVKAQSLSTSA